MMSEIKDKSTDKPAIMKEFSGITTFSDEIMVSKAHFQDLLKALETAETDNQAANDHVVDSKMGNN